MDIWDCALGFMDAQVLMTAEQLGVFDQLDPAPRTPAEVAAATGLPEDSAARLLTMLSAMDLVHRSPDGRYANAPQASEQLVKGKPRYIGAMFQHLRDDVYPLWGHAREALLTGQAQWEKTTGGSGNDRLYEDPQALRQFMQGMHGITFQAADEFAAETPELAQVAHIVDIGGASGAFLIALATRFPALRGTVYDLPPVQAIAEDFIGRAGLRERLAFQAGNFWSDPLPQGADAFSLGFILHDWSTDQGEFLLDRIARAIRPGGWLVLGEFLLNDERTGPRWVARSDLNMLVAARGRERSAPEYARWLGRFGFDLQRVYSTRHAKSFLLFRHRKD